MATPERQIEFLSTPRRLPAEGWGQLLLPLLN